MHQLTNWTLPCIRYLIRKNMEFLSHSIMEIQGRNLMPRNQLIWGSVSMGFLTAGHNRLLSVYMSPKNLRSLLWIYSVANKKLKCSNRILLPRACMSVFVCACACTCVCVCVCVISHNILQHNENMCYLLRTNTHRNIVKGTKVRNILKYGVSYWNSIFYIKIQTELACKVTQTTYPSITLQGNRDHPPLNYPAR